MHEFIGRWRIEEMETWPKEYVDLVEDGFFSFEEEEDGEFVFGALHGWLDVRVSGQEPFLEYSWQGVCEGDELCGRGWFKFDTPDTGEGMFFIHSGDESAVIISRKS